MRSPPCSTSSRGKQHGQNAPNALKDTEIGDLKNPIEVGIDVTPSTPAWLGRTV